MQILTDLSSERAVLSGLIKYKDIYFDICDILNEASFTDKSNQVWYKCFKTILEREQKIDLPNIFSVARELKLDYILEKSSEMEHLNALFKTHVEETNIRKFAAKIRKLQITRLLRDQLDGVQDQLLSVTGNESVNTIVGMAENAVIDFTSLINDIDENPRPLGQDIEEHVEFLAANPVDQIGISIGLPRWEQAIGSIRPGTVNVMGMRPKVGKSTVAINGGLFTSANNIPTLLLDTEMTKEDQQARILACLSEVNINDIERGKFANSFKENKVKTAANKIAKLPFYFKSIAGTSFEDQIAIMRRWLLKEVGLNEDNTAKPCLIIYDYLKLMDGKDLNQSVQEYQAIGFIMTALHNFAVRYKVPILSFVQLNRDGIEKEDTSAAAQSDRIIWLCSNFSICKFKSDEEIAQDGIENGNRKLIPIVCRHGEGLPSKCYINLHMKGYISKVIEGKTNFELYKIKHDGFESTEPDTTEPVKFADV